jgi:hypothetical protein
MQFLNVIVQSANVQETDVDLIFGPHNCQDCRGCDFCRSEEVFFMPQETDMYDLLVKLGAFPSKSQARRVWTKTGKDIPAGFSHFERIGKLRRVLTIWNPTE